MINNNNTHDTYTINRILRYYYAPGIVIQGLDSDKTLGRLYMPWPTDNSSVQLAPISSYELKHPTVADKVHSKALTGGGSRLSRGHERHYEWPVCKCCGKQHVPLTERLDNGTMKEDIQDDDNSDDESRGPRRLSSRNDENKTEVKREPGEGRRKDESRDGPQRSEKIPDHGKRHKAVNDYSRVLSITALLTWHGEDQEFSHSVQLTYADAVKRNSVQGHKIQEKATIFTSSKTLIPRPRKEAKSLLQSEDNPDRWKGTLTRP